MLISELYLAFVIAALLIELTPGPNMVYLAILSLSEGRVAGLRAVAGVALGLTLVGIGAALGLTALIQGSDLLYQLLRWAGIIYLLWLAYEGWREAGENSPASKVEAAQGARYFLRGLITNLLNPKAGVFYVAVLPGFVDQARPAMAQLFALSLTYVLVATIIHIFIVLLAEQARSLLQSERKRRQISRVLSLLLVGVAIWFYFKTMS